MSIATDYHDILHRIASWPPDQRRALAEEILASVNDASPRKDSPRNTLDRALGLLKGSQPTPTDADVARILDERRMEKYGG